MDAFRAHGKVLETNPTAFEAKRFTLNSSLSFIYFPSLSCKCFHFISEVLKPLIRQSRTGLPNQVNLYQMGSSLGPLSGINISEIKALNKAP